LRIRLRLRNAPQLADLPWEYLYNSSLNRFLALSVETPLVRFLDLPERVRPVKVSPPIRVLVMISSPTDYPQLNVEAEWKKLTEALNDLEHGGRVTLERLDDATLAALQRRLRQGEYHIFHFVGHGEFDERTQDGVLLLEDEENRGRRVSGQYLGALLHDHRPLRLAILNACEGARTSRTDPFAGTAQSLVQQGIPAVIAMQFEVTDEAASTFAREFYGALAGNYPVDAALAEARKAIFAQGNEVEWGTPVLYMRAEDGRIFDVEQLSGEGQRKAEGTLLYRDAQAAVAAENWAAAIEKLQALLTLDPAHPEATALLGRARTRQDLAALYKKGRDEYEARHWREALEAFRQVQEIGGEYKEVAALMAMVRSELAKEQVATAAPAVHGERRLEAQRVSRPSGARLLWIGGIVGLLLVAGGGLVLRGGRTTGQAPVIEAFAADRTQITQGDKVTLTWHVQNAQAVEITPSTSKEALDPRRGRVTITPSVPGAHTFTLVARRDGRSAERAATVTVRMRPPLVKAFKAEVHAGQRLVLRWEVTDATSVTIVPQPGKVASQGRIELAIPSGVQQATYHLTATNPDNPPVETSAVVAFAQSPQRVAKKPGGPPAAPSRPPAADRVPAAASRPPPPDLVSRYKPSLVSAIELSHKAEALAFFNLDPAPLYAVYTGEALREQLQNLKALADNGVHLIVSLHDLRYSSFVVRPDGSLARVRMSLTVSGVLRWVATGECAGQIPRHQVPQTVFLRRTSSGWIIYDVDFDRASPEPIPC
jgi:hypothetical protein